MTIELSQIPKAVRNTNNSEGQQGRQSTVTDFEQHGNASSGSTEKGEEDETKYPTGIRLFMIGVGLMLAVICSNLVSFSICSSRQHPSSTVKLDI
jgi:hypothetical protein